MTDKYYVFHEFSYLKAFKQTSPIGIDEKLLPLCRITALRVLLDEEIRSLHSIASYSNPIDFINWAKPLMTYSLLQSWYQLNIVLYSHLQHHNDTINKQSMKTSLQIYCTSHLIARVRKGCVGFYCEREQEIEHNGNILTSTLMAVNVVSFSFFWCSTGAQRPTLLGDGFLYCILSATSLVPKLHQGFPRAPSAGCGFPYHISSTSDWNSTATQLLDFCLDWAI